MKTIFGSMMILAVAVGVGAAKPMAGSPATRLLSLVSLGRPCGYENLTVFPLIAPVSSYSSYTLLDDAIRSGQVRVQEKNGGEVNTVMVRNTGKTHVFGMAGEIISGAKQDRMVGNDVLLPPNSGWLDLPVYCTEHGRWSVTTPSFSTKSHLASGRLRERAARTQSQQEVWAEVDAAHKGLGVSARSRAFAKVYEDEGVREQSRPYVDKLSRLPDLSPGATGVAVAVGNQLLCVDVFGSPALFRKMWPKLLKSYVVDAMQSLPVGRIGQNHVKQLVDDAARAKVADQPTIGAGSLQRISARRTSGSALVFGNAVVHIGLFPSPDFATDDGSVPRLDFRRQRTLH